MAFYQNDQDEEQNNASGMNQSQEQQNGGSNVQLSGQSATISSGSQAPTPQAPKSNSSGAAPGFQNYAKANQGTAQNRLNDAVAKNVANQGQAAKSAINQANTAFNQQVDAGSLANRQNALQDVSNTLSAARNLKAPAAPTNTGIVPPQQHQVGLATPPAAPAAASPLNSMDQNQVNRFKEVINAQYQGPESLRQAGLYNKAMDKVNTAQNTLNNTGTASGREEILKNMYQQRADYTSGLGKLDSALLNASQQGVQNLQNTAKAQGNVRNQLDQAQIGSAQTSKNRAEEITNIKNQARQAFTEQKKAEEAATEARLSQVVADWDKLPQYFKDLVSGKNTVNGKQILNNEITDFKTQNNYAQVASQAAAAKKAYDSIRSQMMTPQFDSGGMPIFTNRPDMGKLNAAKKTYESALAKQTALDKKLGSLKNSYNKNAIYLSPEEAAILGVQSGEGLYNLGANAIATANADKQRLISKDEQARQAALSSLAGLDLSNQLDTNLLYNNADLAGTQTATDALDLEGTRARINEAEKNFRDSVNRNIVGYGSKKNKTSGKRYHAEEKANLKKIFQNAGYDFNKEYSDNVGNGDLLNSLQSTSDTSHVPEVQSIHQKLGLGDTTQLESSNAVRQGGALSDATNPVLYGPNIALNALGLGSVGDIVGSVFGGGANSRASKNKAKQFAQQDLKKKVDKAINASGFNNRIAISDDDAVTSRSAALQELLNKLDKTNIG